MLEFSMRCQYYENLTFQEENIILNQFNDGKNNKKKCPDIFRTDATLSYFHMTMFP